MKNKNSYSELTNEIISSIKEDFDSYVKLNGNNINKLEKFINTEIDSACNTRKRVGRIIFKIFGITFNCGKVYTSIHDEGIMLSIIGQIEPLIKYFSKDFLLRLSARLGNESSVYSSDSNSITNFIIKLSKRNELTDYLMDDVSEKQFEIASKNEKKINSLSSKANTDVIKNNKDSQVSIANKEAALKEEVQRLRKQLDRRNISSGSDELLIERLEDSIINVAPSLKFINEKWQGDGTFHHDESATEVLHISDWHIGEVDNIGGLNQFNYKIACERVKALTNKVISWTKMHRSMYSVDELVIIATGDMISGDIHDELKATNEFPAPEQCVKSAMLISKMASELSSVFKKVRIEYIVADNHSRTTKKIEFAPGTNSYNYIVGTMVQIMLRDNDNIEFNLYPEIEHIIKVEGLNYLITHGNSIRGGQLGLPYYGMTRRLGAEAMIRMNMPEDSHFNRIVMGHYHTPLMTNGIEMTGCLSSTTAFDHASGRHSRACQSAWLVSKKFEMDYSVFWLS